MLSLENSELAWAEEELAHVDVPTVVFEGDDLVPVDYAEAVPDDPKEMRLPLIATRGVLKVARKFGATIDPETLERVKRMTFVGEAADVYLDTPGLDVEEREQRHHVLTNVVYDIFRPDGDAQSSVAAESLYADNRVLYGGMRYWANSVVTMPVTPRQNVTHHAVQTVEHSLAKFRSANLLEYAAQVYVEARNYGEMWAHTAWSGQNESNQEQLPSFTTWMGEFVGAISLIGASTDFAKDYRDGNIQFKPPLVRGAVRLNAMSLAHMDDIVPPLVQWKIKGLRESLRHRLVPTKI